jgi:hypothetical protein
MMGPHNWSSFSSYSFEIHYLNNYGKCEQNEEAPYPLEELYDYCRYQAVEERMCRNKLLVMMSSSKTYRPMTRVSSNTTHSH